MKQTLQAVTDMILETFDLYEVADINSGYCQEWAEEVVGKVSGAECLFLEHNGVPHACVLIGDLYYDSECIGGTADHTELLVFHRKSQSVARQTATEQGF